VAPLVVVQMGHCFRETGATGGPGEQAYARDTAEQCRRELIRRGYRVRVILADEPSAAYRGDAFIAIHADASTATSAHGASVGYRESRGKTLAVAWKAAYQRHGWKQGFRSDNYTSNLRGYYGTREALDVNSRCRAFIAEAGFLTNAEDRKFITSSHGRRCFALAFADALDSIYGRPSPSDTDTFDAGAIMARLPILRRGHEGQHVANAQSLINAHLPGTPLKVDSDFGPATESKTKEFQRQVKIGADGVIGPVTWAKLLNV